MDHPPTQRISINKFFTFRFLAKIESVVHVDFHEAALSVSSEREAWLTGTNPRRGADVFAPIVVKQAHVFSWEEELWLLAGWRLGELEQIDLKWCQKRELIVILIWILQDFGVMQYSTVRVWIRLWCLGIILNNLPKTLTCVKIYGKVTRPEDRFELVHLI